MHKSVSCNTSETGDCVLPHFQTLRRCIQKMWLAGMNLWGAWKSGQTLSCK